MKVYKILFWWYYKLVPEFFHEWPLLKSIRLLAQNYEHLQLLYKNEQTNFEGALKELDATRKELIHLRMMQSADGNMIDHLNKSFGTDFNKPTDN